MMRILPSERALRRHRRRRALRRLWRLLCFWRAPPQYGSVWLTPGAHRIDGRDGFVLPGTGGAAVEILLAEGEHVVDGCIVRISRERPEPGRGHWF